MDFSIETLAIPLITEDRHLLDALRPICEEAAKEHKTAQGTLRSLVENEVHKLLPHGKANRQRVAKALALTERTLAQKLAMGFVQITKILLGVVGVAAAILAASAASAAVQTATIDGITVNDNVASTRLGLTLPSPALEPARRRSKSAKSM